MADGRPVARGEARLATDELLAKFDSFDVVAERAGDLRPEARELDRDGRRRALRPLEVPLDFMKRTAGNIDATPPKRIYSSIIHTAWGSSTCEGLLRSE